MCGTGYTGEDGVELLLRPEDAAALWDESCARGAVPAGLGRARHAAAGGLLPPVRQRSDRRAQSRSKPGSAGAARRTPASSASEAVRAAREAGPAEKLVAFVDRRPRDRPPGQSDRSAVGWSPAARSRPASAIGIGLAYVPAERAAVGTRLEIDVRGKMRPRRGPRASRSTERARDGRGGYPDELLYHPEHDWARIDRRSREATLGITWYAQDALGEVVFFEPPAVGTPLRRTRPTPRSSRSRPCPTWSRRCRGRSSRSTRRSPTIPRRSTRTPTARVARAGSRSRPVRARCAARRATPTAALALVAVARLAAGT